MLLIGSPRSDVYQPRRNLQICLKKTFSKWWLKSCQFYLSNDQVQQRQSRQLYLHERLPVYILHHHQAKKLNSRWSEDPSATSGSRSCIEVYAHWPMFESCVHVSNFGKAGRQCFYTVRWMEYHMHSEHGHSKEHGLRLIPFVKQNIDLRLKIIYQAGCPAGRVSSHQSTFDPIQNGKTDWFSRRQSVWQCCLHISYWGSSRHWHRQSTRSESELFPIIGLIRNLRVKMVIDWPFLNILHTTYSSNWRE